jgi:hypothetical protein
MSSNLSIVLGNGASSYQVEDYHEVVIDRFFQKLPKDKKFAALLAQLSEEQKLELQKENAAHFEFFTHLPNELLCQIFSHLSTYEAFCCHAVCKQFFNNMTVDKARNQVADSVLRGFYRQKFMNFGLLTTEIKKAVRVLDFAERHLKGVYPGKQEANEFPDVDTITVSISKRSQHLSFFIFDQFQYFSALKKLEISGSNDESLVSNRTFSPLPKSIVDLTFYACRLQPSLIQQIPSYFTSLKSLTIDFNLGVQNEDDTFDSFPPLPITVETLRIPHDILPDARCLSHLTNLRTLHLHSLERTAFLSALPTSLTELFDKAAENGSVWSQPDRLKDLTHLTNLKTLEFALSMHGTEEDVADALKDLPEWLVSLIIIWPNQD